jgi:hypothetical protein
MDKRSESQFPTSNVRVIPKENINTSEMEEVSKAYDNENDFDAENPVDRESVNLKPRNLGTPHQTSSWVQKIDSEPDTFRAQTLIHPFKKSGPPSVSGIGEGATVEEARNKSFNDASNTRMARTQSAKSHLDAVDRQGVRNKKMGYNKAPVIKINSDPAKGK